MNNWLWTSLYHAAAMGWATLWALVLGFAISAALQVFVSKEQMSRAFGRAGLREVAIATGLGAASSSCSYAAAAAGRSALQKGAALIPVLAFMFASTNLVVELGAMLWTLMGWRFVLAEFVGAFVLIGVMWLLARLFAGRDIERDARAHAQGETPNVSHGCCASEEKQTASVSSCCGHDDDDADENHDAHESASTAVSNRPARERVADAFFHDWQMLWKEMLVGFLIAGFLATLVPAHWWEVLFLKTGPAPLRLVENAIVGPIIASASFLCSCANIPLASILWSHGISFGGVISFVYADLIAFPLLVIYGKYFGKRAAFRIALVFFLSMVAAGILVDLLFAASGLTPQRDAHSAHAMTAMSHAAFQWNYTTWLNLAAIFIGGWLLLLHFGKSAHGSGATHSCCEDEEQNAHSHHHAHG